MKLESLSALQTSLNSKKAFVYLVLSNLSEEREKALAFFKHDTHIKFSKENFSIQNFIEEVQNQGFFSKETTVIIEDVDALDTKSLEAITETIAHPKKGVTIVLSAKSIHAQSKLNKIVAKQGVCLKFKEQKPWEREKQEAADLCAQAKEHGVILSTQVALDWVKSMSGCQEQKHMEFEKTICFLGFQGEITHEVLAQIGSIEQKSAIWSLADAVFSRDLSKSCHILSELFEETGFIFSLISYMRSQFDLGLKVIHAYLSGGKEKAALVVPYLKGALLEKKIQTWMNYKPSSLKNGLRLIMQTELKAKSQTVDQQLLLEILITKLCLV